MTFIDATAMGLALPAIATAMNVSSSQSLWIVAASAIPLAVLLIPAGVLADRLGRRKTLVTGLVLFAIASMACAMATDMIWLISSRVMQGVGGAMIVVGSLAVLTAAHPPDRRGRAIGAWSAACAAALVTGPLLGGAMAQAGLWRGIFIVQLPLAMITLLYLRRVPETKRPSPPVAAAPPAPAPVWRNAVVRGALASALLIYTAVYGLLLVMPLALIAGSGYRPDHAAVAQLPMLLLLVAACPIAGRWMDRRGPRPPACIGCLLAASGLVCLIVGGLGTGISDYAARLLGPLTLVGAGMGLTIVPLSATVMNGADAASLGAAAAINALVARVAALLAVGVFGGVLVSYGVVWTAPQTPEPADWDPAFRAAMAVAALLCASASALAAHHLPTTSPVKPARTAPPLEAQP
ncbi:MAG: MFS transporter [Phycisphaeraceae bacterium]